MPINKFIRIKNIGRFADCVQKGQSLKKYNLFFAENGRGKTTLCAVLRSLQTGEHEHITERITLAPEARSPEVCIRINKQNVTYKKQSWLKEIPEIPEIVIFDSVFITQNIYVGESVTRHQRTNLLQVIIGKTDINLVNKIEDLSEKIRKKNSQIKDAEKAIQLYLQNRMTVKEFVELPEDPDIDSKIAKKKTALKASKQFEKIMAHSVPAQVTAPTLPGAFGKILAKTLSNVSVDASARLKKQLDRHNMHDNGQAWISKGLKWIHDDACPFCGQDTKDILLVQAYEQFFSTSYTALISEIENLQKEIRANMGETVLVNLSEKFRRNERRLQFWERIVSVELTEMDYNAMIFMPVKALRKAALSLADSKRKNPLTKIKSSDLFRNAIPKYNKAVARINAYNQQIDKVNTAIKNQKRNLKTSNSTSIENEIAVLQLIKLQSDANVNKLNLEYKKLVSEKNNLVAKKEMAKENLDEHGGKAIDAYEKTINRLLNKFKANFSITNSKKIYDGNAPSSIYQVLINKQAVDLGTDKTPIGQPCFRTALSSGDKSTLALAFFLAQLHHNPKRKNCIVIFDDPISSLDRFRRERTVELLRKFGKESAQLLLFSHDSFFLHHVYSELPAPEQHCLQLSRASDNTTVIEEWDIKKEMQGKYFKSHATLTSYLENGPGSLDLNGIAINIRLVLEGYFRHRFPHKFASDDGLGTIIKKIRSCPEDCAIRSMLEELESINRFSRQHHHHDDFDTDNSKPISDHELQGYVESALSIIHNDGTNDF